MWGFGTGDRERGVHGDTVPNYEQDAAEYVKGFLNNCSLSDQSRRRRRRMAESPLTD